VRDGLKVIMFEQTAAALGKRLGFRVQEYGLRQVFVRVPDHPIITGMKPEFLHDWCGQATILPPKLKYEMRPRYGPTVEWCGIPVTQIWRCGNRGNVASVLIEKPSQGDFMPILDGGYSLQYSPLMEYREGKGMIIFCQMDVTARTDTEPAAEAIVRNLFRYIEEWKSAPRRQAVYLGEAAGKNYLESVGLSPGSYENGELSPDCVLIAGPDCSEKLAGGTAAITDWLKAGGFALTIGLDQSDVTKMLSSNIAVKKAEHISTYFRSSAIGSLLEGVGPADVHNRDPRELPLVSSGAQVIGDGVLAKAEHVNVVFCQLAPWQFDGEQANLRRTRRRVSFLVSRLLANMGVSGSTPILDRFAHPIDAAESKGRWLDGLYLDKPEEWDAPYRFFRW